MQNMVWFHSLNKPFLSPPDAVFLPVWSVLYLMMAISFFILVTVDSAYNKKLAITFFVIQMLLNFVWSPIFFMMKNIGLALAVIILMWIFILLTIITVFKHSKLAAILLIPYLIWVSFAFYLNLGFYVLN